ncbi:MAG: AAA family ATPase [archaeon]
MKINEVEILGFKGIPKLTIHPKKINILVGKNNTGKTSVLEAIEYTLKSKIGHERHPSSLINVNRTEAKVVIKLENENKYLSLKKPELKEIIPEFKKQLFDRLKKISPRTNNKNEWEKAEELLDKILNKEELIFEIKKESIRIESGSTISYMFSYTPSITKEIEPLIEYINKFILRGVPKDMIMFLVSQSIILYSETEKSEKQLTFIKNLGMTELMPSPNKSKINEIENYLKDRKILNNLERFDFDKLLFKNNEKEYEIPFSFMGDGFNSLIGLIARISVDTKIVLLEEPENHMHPAYIKEIVRQIIELSMARNMQFFITTHNADILDVVSTDMLEPKHQEYLSKELNIIRLDCYDDDIIAQELTKEEATAELEDLKIDLRGM